MRNAWILGLTFSCVLLWGCESKHIVHSEGSVGNGRDIYFDHFIVEKDKVTKNFVVTKAEITKGPGSIVNYPFLIWVATNNILYPVTGLNTPLGLRGDALIDPTIADGGQYNDMRVTYDAQNQVYKCTYDNGTDTIVITITDTGS